MKSFNRLIAGIGAALILVFGLPINIASAEFTPVMPITKAFDIEGQQTTITIHPEFAVSGQNGVVKVDLSAVIDATDLQRNLINMLNKRWKFEDCGERFTTSNPTIRPADDGQLHIGITAQAQKWACGGTKIPKIYCKDTWIITKLPFGAKLKTKGIPKCTTKMEYEGWKTKLISQSVRAEALVRAVVNGDTIAVDARVTKAMPSGLAKHLVNAFGLHNKIKDLVQQEVNDKLHAKQYRLPEEVRAYDVVIREASFIDLGDGRLGLKVSASGTITQKQLAILLNGKINELN